MTFDPFFIGLKCWQGIILDTKFDCQKIDYSLSCGNNENLPSFETMK
jgi:hypothetical protein